MRTLKAASRHVLETKVQDAWPLSKWSNLTVLVACSGGADSTALLLALLRLKPSTTSLIVAHYNHQLRGAASDGDQHFVMELAASHGLRCLVQNAANQSKVPQSVEQDGRQADLMPSEEQLRDQRYAFLEKAASESGARYVAMGHTADDQAETVVHRLCRGAGLSGLSGVPMFRMLGQELVIVRPLLRAWRHEVIDYLAMSQQPHREDDSNALDVYTRNYVRLEILPKLEEKVHPHAKQNIVEAAATAAELIDWFQAQADAFLTTHARVTPLGMDIRKDSLRMVGPILGKEVLRRAWRQCGWGDGGMTRRQWQQLYDLAVCHMLPAAQPLTTDFPGQIRLRSTDETVHLSRVDKTGKPE